MRTHDHHPQITGFLNQVGPSEEVTITVYELENMTEVPIAESGCYPIGDTGRWGWSTVHLPDGSASGRHFFYHMAGGLGGDSFSGEFFLQRPQSERRSSNMAVHSSRFQVYAYRPDAPQAIVGALTSGANATIRIWQDGVELNLPTSGCQELGDTGKFAWSTAHLPKPLASREQFHWQMDDDQGGSDWGDVVRFVPGGENMLPKVDLPERCTHRL